MQRFGSLGGTDVRRPFGALLLEDDQERADAVRALLVGLSAAEVRVIRMGDGSRRSHGTLEHILIQAAGPEREVFSGDTARLIVGAITKQQAHEKGVMLLIRQAETVHPKMLHALQAMAPYFTQNGKLTLQVTFVGRPAFLALLDGPGMKTLREALKFQGGPQVLEAKTADSFVEPTAAARPRILFPRSSGANELPGRVKAARILRAAQPLKATAGVSGELPLPSPAAPLRAAGSQRVDDGVGCREPMLVQPSAPLVEPSAAKPAVASARALRHGRALLRLVLVLAALVIAAGAAYVGLRRVFYRDVPARSAVSVATPATPPPAPSSSPVPSVSAPSTPVPPPAELPAPSPAPSDIAPPLALHDTATPSIISAAPLSAEQSARLRQDFDAFLASSGRNVATLSGAQRDTLFGEYLDWRSQSAPASTAPNAAPSMRIVIHVPAGSEAAEALSAHLLASLPPQSSTLEARRIATTPDHPSIRYFYPEDEAAARLAAAWMADTGLNWTLQDLSTFQPLPTRGTIEVWLPRQP